MDREAKRIIRQCKGANKSVVKPPPLEELIATNLTEELMEKFKIGRQKRERLRRFQSEYTRDTKRKEFRTRLTPLYIQPPRTRDPHRVLRKYAEVCPSTRMCLFQERRIRKRVCAKELESRYAHIVEEMIAEIRDEFERITHDAGVNLKVLPQDETNMRFRVTRYKYLGKTERYHVYLRTRKELQHKFMLHHALVQRIFRECVMSLPATLFNISLLRTKPYDIKELDDTFIHCVSEAETTLKRFYYRIVAMVEDDNNKLEGSAYQHLLAVCTGLLSVYISKAISQTIEHIVEATGSEKLVPYLRLSLRCGENLSLYPNDQDVTLVYTLFITNLIDIGVNFQVLETYKIKGFPEKNIYLNISSDFFTEMLDKVACNVMGMFEPVIEYVDTLDEEYKEIFKKDSVNDVETDSFLKACLKIQHYQNYISKASSMLSSEYFAVGQLILSEYVESMKESLFEIIETIFVKLCEIHMTENAQICSEFEKIKEAALTRPSTSEELIEQGKYMIWVKTVLLIQLKERIQHMLNNLTRLVEFGTVSKEHMELNAVTVNWLKNIEPVLDQNSSMYEQIKFEHEEKLQQTIAYVNSSAVKLVPQLEVFDDMDDVERAREYVHQMKIFLAKLKELREKIVWINKEQQCLGFNVSPFKNVEELENFVYPFFHLLKVCLNIRRHVNVWLDGPFEFLNFEDTDELVENYMKELLKIQKNYRIKLRQAQAENTPLRFFGIVDDPDINSRPAPIKLTTLAIQILKDFRPALTLMRIMCNDALMKRHWKEMSSIAGFDLTPNAGTSLRKLTKMGLDQDMDLYDVISSGATKERELLKNLLKMQGEWAEICFKTGGFKDTNITILTALDDIQVVLDDHILKALTMRGSIFVKPYETEVRAFYDRLVRINSTIDVWGKVQSQWLYLLPIFSSKDIVAQMPEEGNLFKEVNDTYKRYIDVVLHDPRVYETAGAVGVLESMEYCCQLLEQINDGVTNYLEKKRLFFPRFFFLSNDEMLEILSETKDPLRVQPHLKKCFEAINSLDFDDKLQISAMYSQEGEKVNFKSLVNTKDAGGSVEKWLIQVENQMVVSVNDQILKSYKFYLVTPRCLWIQKWPGQIILCVSQMHWTYDVHKALNREENMNISTFAEQLRVQLQQTVALIRDPSLTNLSRITVKALIVIDVHAKDVVEDLDKKNVGNDKEFKWLSQLRYYLEDDVPLVRLINATVKYACEYLGNTDRLVITPLTDRCYRTLIGAFHLHLNGAPEGPAGTGKTETTKDLAKAIAVQCVVFNCSDGLDYKAMGKFFKGLASCGAWVCFDEFNRIDIEVLSVVAQQILSIVLAVRAHASKFNFEGTEISLNPSCYVCITMNPGYAGRSELPDNLKVLFRTVAMMVPDYAMIGEISLYSYGFINARDLSVKIVTVYRLCSEQLSSQNHYDYGMRAVKSVLSAAGNNKRKAPNENEHILLLRAILDVNLPKFLHHDLPLFDGIISDLFPGIVLPQADYSVLTTAMLTSINNRKLQPKEPFLVKIIQTYEMMIVRWGFMMVGLPFAGKSSTLKVLADSLTLLNKQGHNEEKVHYLILNPKAVTMGQLYGQFDPVSYEWFDGIVATGFRNFATDPSPDRKWMIFDGPVDAVWIENMNSVLDDNKKLCLMSGEVMSMTNSMSLIFEVMDLEQASPATVSRCGMIYLEPSTLGWQPFVESWIPTCNPEWCGETRKDMIFTMFEWMVPPCLQFIRKYCVQYCNPGEISLVRNMMLMLEMLLNDAIHGSTKKEEEAKHLDLWIQITFIQAGVWGLGSILDKDSRTKFDEFYKQLWRGQLEEEYPFPETVEKMEISIPSEGILFDYSYHYKMKGNWRYWPEVVRTERVDECKNILQALIPTVDTARYMALIDMHIRYKNPLLLMGPTGTGKSFYMTDILMNQLNKEKYEPAFITFTVQISANQAQELVISKLNKRKRGHYGPPKGKTTVLFIDDVNMPLKEVYGAQPPIELLRQYFDHKNWYDLKTTSPIYLYDILFLGAMGLVGGSRQEIYPRFLRHFNIFSINEFSLDSMSKIYANVLLLGWKNNGFPSEIISVVHQVVTASIDVYNAATENLRPTPSKSHYVFNLRDFSRLIQGCAMLRKESAEQKKTFAKIWVHEVMRVFYDRLIEKKDKEWLYSKLRTSVKDQFRENFEVCFENLPREADGLISENSLKNLMFGTYFDQDSDEDKRYDEVLNIQQFRELGENCLHEYNATHKNKMDIVLFDYALEHLSKICRVLSMNCGSALLVGISGSGRQSLTRLASEIYGQALFQPEITNNYTISDWRDDIKIILKEAGGRGKHCVFLITEGQIKEENFLQDVDCLLNSGEVPNMYAIDEKQEILDMVRLAAQGGNRNLDVGSLEVFFFFTKRCKDKLHIILCFSPVGSTFRNRLRLFPSLINCCTIDWFEDWPEQALEEVAHSWMEDINLSDEIKHYSVVACKYFHVEARNNSDLFFKSLNRKTYITSASYLELIRSFTDLTNKKQNEVMQAKKRYEGGLEKLYHASVSIGEMQKSLAELQPQLKDMSEQATKMTKQIEHETITVEKASAVVKEDEKVANKQAAAAQNLKRECEADLAEAIPILDEAIAALDTLKPADITLVKSMKNPPEIIKLVMAAVCIIKDVKPDRKPDPSTGKMTLDFWGPSKRLLGDMNFLQGLKDFDKDNIKPDVMVKLRKEYIPHKDFKPSIVAKASSAAEGLCKWIIAMDMYDRVNKIVAPKKAKLAAAETEFAATMALLSEKRNQVMKLEEQLAILNEKLAEAVAKQTSLQENVDLCNNKLIRAQKLIGGLGGEKTRWQAAAEALQVQYDGLAGDILISCGIISYLSPFNSIFRQRIVADWHKYVKDLKIPTGDAYDMVYVLGSDVKIQNWYIYGLPRDSFSTENGIIMDNSRRWSLFVDPQSQASNWIKKMEKLNNLEVVKFSFPDYMKRIEVCVQLGYPALVESIGEELEAPLDPLLYKKVFKQAGMLVISLGENVTEYNTNFRLYLTSKLRNPHYLPEVFNRVTIINFALTLEGLQDQLLGIVVAVEKPDLQQLKEELIVQKAENKRALQETEENILKTLAESKGDILEDEKAIQILDESKSLSKEIREKQERSLEIEKTIEEFRGKYKIVSEHSAVLYYCISDLANVDPMYQYSLDWFINLYIGSIQRAEKFRNIEKRCQSLINAFTYDLYSNITRSLFEKDKLLFSFLLCSKIMMFQQRMDEQEFMFLLTGGVAVENLIRNPCSSWLPHNAWDEICRVDDLKSFNNFSKIFTKNESFWKEIYDDFQENFVLPKQWEKLNSFKRLIIVRMLRPDKLLTCIMSFVKTEMDERFVKPPPFDIAVSYSDSYSLCPLIFILSPGTDPMAALVKFAEEMKMTDRFHSISLGQGQGPMASAMIKEGQDAGMWVCLQNCHLATSWMPTLEKIFDNLDFSNTHDQFRLWLTSYPSPKFPVTLLQKGVKMTNEPPQGLQNNLLKSYISDPVKNPDFYDGCPEHEEMFARLLYGLAFFHACVQERRTFGPLGWNIAYGFNDSDFDISVQQLQMFINESEDPYEALAYLIGECNYGGRVTDNWDRRLIVTILETYLNPMVVYNSEYSFSEVGSCYGLPERCDYESYIRHIQSLPSNHPPEVFGLHTNAGITRDLQDSTLLLNSVLKVYGETAGASVGETDKYLMVLCTDILSKLPKPFDLEVAKTQYPVEYSESMNTVLVQEMERFNKLLKVIAGSLITMQKAIQGLVAMSPALEAFSSSLMLGRIPDNWAAVSYPSLKNLPSYVSDFIIRMEFLQNWFKKGKPPTFWVSGFFFTQAFLTGVKQNYARKYTIPIDKLTFDFAILKVDDQSTPPPDGAYIFGLFTDGARWYRDQGKLEELFPKILYDVLPIVWLQPIKESDFNPGKRYTCPVYKTSARKGTLSTTGHSTNYVLPILLDTDKDPSHWIKRSVALLCQLN
ncbi:dynein heavy chain 12, axonemal [Anoplophora glabripennis]|uniref:dynein heavy chain 12, axonemal n=1 Tax=Anoplophora glabripennis TaxID=217634 RepID=UPI0008757F4A|nr:dynein heavy chain 12, axonemal [Anoplophora glabripennis]